MVVSPWLGENFEEQYGQIEYEGKIVLDIGAEVGSTASFFLSKGAKLVIAVEGSSRFIRNLWRNSKTLKCVVPKSLWITQPIHISELILKYKPDIVKMDCEGCEAHLVKVPNDVFSLVPEYVIETHCDILLNDIIKKCGENNYIMGCIIPWAPHVNIVYARR